MRIVFACDHAGFELKEYLKNVVSEEGYTVDDVGAYEFDAGDDYPDFVARAGEAVSSDPINTRAIVLGYSGQGEAIVANRYANVRAVVYVGEPIGSATEKDDMLTLTREHNDANVLSLGAHFLTNEGASQAVLRWLQTAFSGDERHVRRIQKIESLTQRDTQ
jgi:ribose 5-phosphate isomerase B